MRVAYRRVGGRLKADYDVQIHAEQVKHPAQTKIENQVGLCVYIC